MGDARRRTPSRSTTSWSATASSAAQPSPFSLHFDHREIGEVLGYIVENRHIRRALLRAVEAQSGILFLPGVAVEGLAVGETSTTLNLSDGQEIESPLAVAAEGRESPLREAQGIRSVAWDYPQIGIVTTVEHERPHNGVAYEHFLPSGPFAILPMTGNRASLVWTEETTEARRLVALDEPAFTAELACASALIWATSGRSGRAGPIR